MQLKKAIQIANRRHRLAKTKPLVYTGICCYCRQIFWACNNGFKINKFCSRDCSNLGRRSLLGGVTVQGYRTAYNSRNKKSLEHRVKIEDLIGRPLNKNEHIHHIDFNKLNNNSNNLLMVSNSTNNRLNGICSRLTRIIPREVLEQITVEYLLEKGLL